MRSHNAPLRFCTPQIRRVLVRTAFLMVSQVVACAAGCWAAEAVLGADSGIRTHGLDLGKVALYQLSYARET